MATRWDFIYDDQIADAYITAFIFCEILQQVLFEELIIWTTEPVLLPRVMFGKHRGSAWNEVPVDYLALSQTLM
jgi:exodeoxyribonuclease X